MLEVNGQVFLYAVTEMKHVQSVIENDSTGQWSVPIDEATKPRVIQHIDIVINSVDTLYARTALIAARRLKTRLESEPSFNWSMLSAAMADIQSRLSDELSLVRLFVMDPNASVYLAAGADLLGPLITGRFPSVVFEMEEAAKCLALQRPTASAFHAIRALEVAIRTLSAFLGIPDPVKPAERNWAIVLKAIKDAIDQKYPARTKKPGSVGARAEDLYASLDAVKNPWRNATMHVETVYQPFEAEHILKCVNMFMLKLVQICDEEGNPVTAVDSPSPSLALPS